MGNIQPSIYTAGTNAALCTCTSSMHSPLGDLEVGRVMEMEGFCPWNPIFKTAIWNVYSMVYFPLKDKNNRTSCCDDKHQQHCALTNYMKRDILLVNEILACVSFHIEQGGTGSNQHSGNSGLLSRSALPGPCNELAPSELGILGTVLYASSYLQAGTN